MDQVALFDLPEPNPTGFPHKMKDGSIKYVDGKALNQAWHYHKQDGKYWLTHTPSGKLMTNAKTLKALKELLQEPEFFSSQITIMGLWEALHRFGNRKFWNY
jgi:hypothetical protein